MKKFLVWFLSIIAVVGVVIGGIFVFKVNNK